MRDLGMKQEYESPGSPVAIPYKWEATPGTPIAEIVPTNRKSPPLRPPPGGRRPTKPAFDGSFEPEQVLVVVAEAQLVERVLKTLNRLRRKSMLAAACFTSSERIIQHSGMLFPDLDVCSSYDSDAARTSYSSTSYESAFSSSSYMTRTPPSTRRFEDVDECFDHAAHLPGPHESAWHIQHSSELKPPACPQKTSIRRSYSALIPAILRQSSSSSSSRRSFSLGRRPFRRSQAMKQLDLGKL